MNSKKKKADTRMDVVIAMKKLKRKPNCNKEKINEKRGNSITKSIIQVRMDVDKYSSRVFFIPLLFRSFFNSEKISR